MLSWDNLLLKSVGCDSDTKKNNNFVLKYAWSTSYFPRLERTLKNDFLVDPASRFQTSVCLPKSDVNSVEKK
jgi:hypothetical protein